MAASSPAHDGTQPSLGRLGDARSYGPLYVDRYKRALITLPDGRQIAGRRPGLSAATIPEHVLRDQLAKQVQGVTEASLSYGRADVLTATAVFEVEPVRTWRHGVRQALAYSAECGLPPSLALFGAAHHEDVLKIYLKLRDGKPTIRLWWHARNSWQSITARRNCNQMRDPNLEAVKEWTNR
jgi:hypothetical protein